jgi:competence protein ComEA
VALLGLAILWHVRGGPSGDLVKYDELPRHAIHFETDINQADWAELSELPSVGPTLAKRIVEHREKHGPFHRPEDLRRVHGIGPKTLERIRPHLAPLDDAP